MLQGCGWTTLFRWVAVFGVVYGVGWCVAVACVEQIHAQLQAISAAASGFFFKSESETFRAFQVSLQDRGRMSTQVSGGVVAVMSDPGEGLKYSSNQDGFLVAERITSQGAGGPGLPKTHTLFVLADGIGGQRNGDMASTAALIFLRERFKRGDQCLEETVVAASGMLKKLASLDPGMYSPGMGTTMIGAEIVNDLVKLVHIGDCCAIVVSKDGQIRYQTEGHRLVTELVRSGVISPKDVEKSAFRNIVIRAITAGTWDDATNAHTPTTKVLLLHPGESLILFTDGLKLLSPEEMTKIVSESASPENAVQALRTEVRKRVQSRHDDDNMTVLVYEHTGPNED